MGPGLDLIIYALAILFAGVYSGALSALEVLSLRGAEGADEGESDDSAGLSRLLDDRLHSGLSLSIGRFIAFAVIVVMGLRVLAATFPGGDGSGVLFGLIIVLSLVLPMSLARAAALAGAGGFLKFVRVVVVPSVYLLRPVSILFARLLRNSHPRLLRALSFQVLPLRDKIEIFAHQSEGDVDEEQRIMSSVLEFGETRVREVMVPRIDVVAVSTAMDRDEAVSLMMEAGHSRVPLYDDTIDRVVGILYAKDLLRRIVSGERFSLQDFAREPFFVPESKMIDDLLAEFRARKQHLAIVVDEYGGTAGIVTMEDVLEEIVGDIQDEYDSEELAVERVDDDTVVCSAVTRVDELNEMLGLGLPEDVAESLGGLLYHMVGRIPDVGETWPFGPLVFEIRSVERQRIDKVVVTGLRALDREAEDHTATP